MPGILSPETNWKEELEIYKRYFKIYVPGVGKAFLNIGGRLTGLKVCLMVKPGLGWQRMGKHACSLVGMA